MVNGALRIRVRIGRGSEIFDGDRQVAAILAVGVAGDDQPPAEAEAEIARGIEPGRGGRSLVTSSSVIRPPPASRVRSGAGTRPARARLGIAVDEHGADHRARPESDRPMPSAPFDPSGRIVAAPVAAAGEDQAVEIEAGLDLQLDVAARRCRPAARSSAGRTAGIARPPATTIAPSAGSQRAQGR